MHASTHGKLNRTGLALAAIVDSARARSHRRAAAAARRPTPTSGALAPPVPETIETTATAYDGAETEVVATTSPGNQVSGELPGAEPYDPHLDPPGSLSIAEDSGHPANQRSRPVTWAIVAFIAVAFAVIGFGLLFFWPWLFVAGIAAVVAGCLAGWAAGIMADRGDPRETGEMNSSDRV